MCPRSSKHHCHNGQNLYIETVRYDQQKKETENQKTKEWKNKSLAREALITDSSKLGILIRFTKVGAGHPAAYLHTHI